MTFLVFEVFPGLEIDSVTQVFPLFENVYDSGRTPAINIFDGPVLVHTLAVFVKKKVKQKGSKKVSTLSTYKQ